MKSRFFLPMVALLVAAPPAAGDENVLAALQSIRDSHYHRLESGLLGRPLHLVVRTPRGYEEHSNRRYPVVYLLDGGEIFPMLTGYHNYLVNQRTVPEAIHVALSYAAVDFESGNMRSTDYTAPTDEREWWGGAGNFQRALRDEVLPLVESAYRADPARRVLFGQSIGGQFVLYTALTDPGLFHGHIASNPALHRNLPFFLQRHSDQRAQGSKLFVASGSEDDARFRRPAVAWIEHWNGQDQLPWALRAISIEGYGHFSLVTESYRQGMEWLFK